MDYVCTVTLSNICLRNAECTVRPKETCHDQMIHPVIIVFQNFYSNTFQCKKFQSVHALDRSP